MADVSFTVTSIKPGTGAQKQRGTAGATLTPGMAVYLDTATSTWKIGHCETSATTAAVSGIALGAASSGQPIIVQTGGNLTTSAHLSLASPVYVLSAAGAICPSADLANGDYITVIGVATSTTNLKLGFTASGVVAAGIA
jgi:hypothetical protein